MMLRRLENMGRITGEAAGFFSHTNPLIARGLIQNAMSMEEEERTEQELLCNRLIRKNMEKVAK